MLHLWSEWQPDVDSIVQEAVSKGNVQRQAFEVPPQMGVLEQPHRCPAEAPEQHLERSTRNVTPGPPIVLTCRHCKSLLGQAYLFSFSGGGYRACPVE